MMRSLYSGVSGLRNHQTRMDVIGNNIANVNTVGYKTSRVVFQDVYSQTSKVAGAPSTESGGTNPIQIGLGVTLAAIDVLHTSSATQRTDNPTDLCIEGDGFFVVQGATQLLYTRAGNLYIDNLGNLVTAGGNYLMGLQSINYVLDVTDPDNPLIVLDSGTPPQPVDPTGDPTYDAANYEIKFGPSPLAYEMIDPTGAVDDINNYSTKINRSALTHINLTGFTGISIDEYGVIRGLDEDGEKQIIAKIALATFTNPAGLEKKGNSQYAASANSGQPVFSDPYTFGAGKTLPGGLEMSNVDLAAEFTDMIVTQRGFQANSRIITTSDSLLEELVNLKR